jgi:hypothetical protein
MDTLFLTLNELPHDEDLDLNFYSTADGSYFSPRRHWCLVGQIVSVETFLRLRLLVRDRDGVQFQIAIHTDDRGSNFLSSLLVPGYTVTILYAHQHRFLDSTTGIRQEEKQTLRVSARMDGGLFVDFESDIVMQIFGTDLETFCRLQSSIKAQKYTGSTCHGCGSITAAKMRCAKCTLVAYCNKVCYAVSHPQHC